MKTLIIYSSKYGAVQECAEKLKGLLDGETDIVQMEKKAPKVVLAGYDRVVIGGSIHAGKLQKNVRAFCDENLDALKAKKVGLFLSSLTPPEQAGHYFTETFPEGLVKSAKAMSGFGGKVVFESMNPIERFILKKITKTDKSFSRISDKHIGDFADAIKKA
jgi:menaquinone-dependent protoporphyrinogen oxidase